MYKEFFHAIKREAPARGFMMNMIPAREDGKARLACNLFFGENVVNKVTTCLHRSKMNYDLLTADLFEYDRKHVPRMKDPVSLSIYRMVIQSIKDDLGNPNLSPISYEDVRKLPDFPGAKSPGLPYKQEGVRTKTEAFDLPGNLDRLKKIWLDIGRGRKHHLPDVCLFGRAQIAKAPKEKIRATWGYSFDVYLEEARFFYPIQKYIKEHEHNFPIAYGLEMANGGMSSINDLILRNPSAKIVVSDWSKFDKTIPPWLIRDAFLILEGLLNFSSLGRASHEYARFKRLVDYFVETPIRTCKGERFTITGGVPSGSCFTNIIDSIINCIVTRFLIYQTTNSFPQGEIFLGDDGIFLINGMVNLEDIASLAIHYFGMILNVDKSYITTNPTNVHFLGYFNYYGFPFKNQDFLIASFIFPEHKRIRLIDACAAALGQMYSGFDTGYARVWIRIIHYLADCETTHPFSTNEIVLHLRNNEYRHKYLAQVGISSHNMTIPNLQQNQILEVLPKTACKFQLPNRSYDYRTIFDRSKSIVYY